MKKVFTIFVFALMLFSFASIGLVNADEDNDSVNNSGPGSVDSGSDRENDSDDDESNGESEIEIEIESDSEEDETEIEIEREGNKLKIKAKGNLTDEQIQRIRNAIQNRNRLRIHADDSELPENCTRTGAVIRCETSEKLRTRTNYEGPLSSEKLRDLIYDLKISFEGIENEIEVEIEVEREENETEFESSIEGNLTESQLELIELIEDEMVSLVENSDLEEVELELEIKNEYERNRTMAVFAGNSGNTILQVKGVNASTDVELYHHNGKVYGFDNETNESILINYFPDEVRERIRERIRANIDENETEIEIDEEGKYRVEMKKDARLLYMFKVKERVRAQVDAETGEIIRVRNPWWGFLARDLPAESEDNNSTDVNETA